MDFTHYLAEALELVSAWELPDDDFAKTVNDQAKIMAGIDLAFSGLDDRDTLSPPQQL